jgi:2-polyprenyl-3-methyl-5-hydroxy-6-metoxy-1,4-benzoquinol methylase
MTLNKIEQGYLLASASELEKRRLEAFGRVYNPGTIAHLEAIGVGSGWKCLDIGAGTGEIARWLSDRVGSTERVVATDLNTQYLNSLDAWPNIEVRQHNISADPLERSEYDLVTARLLLEHLPERESVLQRMVEALKPGGWLLVEDFDFRTLGLSFPQTELNARIGNAGAQLFSMAGADVHYGTKLPFALARVGLDELGNQGRLFATGRGPEMEAVLLLLQQLKDLVVGSNLMTAGEVDEVIGQVTTGESFFYWPIMMASWGRKPLN